MKIYNKKINNYITVERNKIESGDLYIYGDIVDNGNEYFETDISPNIVLDSLSEMNKSKEEGIKELNIHITSNGGSVTAGNAIVSIIDTFRENNKCNVNAYIEGIAASMGSGIAMVADNIYMAYNALFMLHKPYSVAIGTEYDLGKQIEVLRKTEDTLVSNYMRHFKGTEDELRKLMFDETWLTAKEALEYGFCDEITESTNIAASSIGIRINGIQFGDNVKIAFSNRNTDITSDKKEIVFNSVKKENIIDTTYITNTSKLNESKEIPYISITKDMYEKTFGKVNISAEELLNYAKNGILVGEKTIKKAESYDKIVENAINDAIKNGVRAKGESFNSDRWKKILNQLDYNEICDQSNEWSNEAKEVLKAGKRISNPTNELNKKDSNSVNPDDYDIF